MFARISNSWELVKASATVLRADKELVVFPIISMIGVLIVTATFAIPAILTGLVESVTKEGGQALGAVVAFLFYVVQYCVIFYANTALVGAAMIRLEGGDPTVSDGFRIASQRIGSIVGYALIAATVGMILRALSERGGLLGKIVSGLIGLAWNLATFLVVPVLVVEDVGPIDAVKRSAGLLKKTWGEQFVGNFSIGMIFFILGLVVCLLGMPIIVVVAMADSIIITGLVIVLFVLVLVTLGVLNATLSGIYSAAVYRYAMAGDTSGYFDEELVQNAFRRK